MTPFDSHTTTSPSGNVSWGNPTEKKPLPQIAAAHGIPYVAVATVGYPTDLQNKVKKALSIKGPKYIQLHSPCPLGWAYKPEDTIEIGRLAVLTGLYPIYEIENGEITKVRKLGKKRLPVEEYLRPQGRFRHLFAKPQGKEEIRRIQEIADENIRRFGLV